MNNDQDPKLREVLRAWQVSPPPAPGFNATVWARISAQEERATAGIWGRLREWLVVQLPKPAYASALLVVTVTLSIAAANLRAGHMREQHRVDSARQYLASIDPLTMAVSSGMPR
ncbi:MAG: hypothetical protein JNK23_12990 [Opitutaceae bacterium]|nr:hypothetical protein [Opitutaceae bacterium]